MENSYVSRFFFQASKGFRPGALATGLALPLRCLDVYIFIRYILYLYITQQSCPSNGSGPGAPLATGLVQPAALGLDKADTGCHKIVRSRVV